MLLFVCDFKNRIIVQITGGGGLVIVHHQWRDVNTQKKCIKFISSNKHIGIFIYFLAMVHGQ